MSTNPDIQWALDILTPDPDYRPSLWEKYGMLVGTPIMLVGGACFRNSFLKRPLHAGLQVHIALTVIGLAVGYKMHELVDNHFAKRDQMLRHYVMLHPEDFPPPERKKWGEVFEPWSPIR
ncbi:NADH dehydrogenase [ubiquinone] 1 subunit C2 [Vespa velutina]|uniref:NADH dehydrogenase [ubiquinone] 1 subunit C2 n=1 Tax=Vespa velutina TaxID=202808 RepID=UPI001FB314B1|nr:NADH dehydrogenase [ubiquinone] 1 subunit C2 [Vespa velutina]XP_047346127.1 NADH dehydrogenase [ubiquinone] 1 subunit C2 [Vespa velutina]XP_047346129.1 NADH dehydrogenase [ubiquinone] 1 subunit C2 [Vespa velutina]